MTLQSFITKYNGRYLEVAGSANALNQCTDAANGYIRDVLGLPIIEWTNAQDFPSKADSNFNVIQNTPTGVPVEGDLIIFKSVNNVGHISIFIDGNANTFNSFDQNYPLGSPCHVQSHTYAHVISWMRCRIDTTEMPDIRLSILNENNIKTEGDLREVLGAYKELPSLKEDKLNADKEIDRLRHLVEQNKVDLKAESDANSALKLAYEDHLQSIGKALGNGADLPGILQAISLLISQSDQAVKLEKQIKDLQAGNADLKAEIARKEDANKSYSTKIDSLTSELGKIKEILSKWLKIPVVTPDSLLGALRGLVVPIEKPLVGRIVDFILSISNKIWPR